MTAPGDTIVACATAIGRPMWGARALVRLSGPDAFDVIDRLLTSPVERTRGVSKHELSVLGAALPVAVMRLVAPASYTGEDTAEIVLPANALLVDAVIDALLEYPGARRAGAGEFTARAYLSGRLSLDEAEGVAQLIGATNEAELSAANRVLSGAAGDRARRLAEEVARLLALVEAGVDFTDQEDVVPIAPAELREAIGRVRGELGKDASAAAATGVFRAVLVGPPSAGKSTLFNALLGSERSMTDAAPGTTRDVIAEPLELEGADIELCDLPGLDPDPAGAIAVEMQAAARRAIDGADLILACDPEGRWDFIDGSRPALRIRTKLDEHGARAVPLAVCALDGDGLDALRRAIADAALGRGAPTAGAHELSVAPRHRRAAREAGRSLRTAAALLELDTDAITEPELVAGELRLALDRLGEITGRITPDDVIGRVFASFCVGK